MKIWLYYWHNKNIGKNLGDWLSLLLVSEFAQHKVIEFDARINGSGWIEALRILFFRIRKRITDPKEAEPVSFFQFFSRFFCHRKKRLFAIGSIMEMGYKNCIYWGTGFMHPSSDFRGGVVRAVRGKLSKDKLKGIPGWETITLGDPSLLLPLWKAPTIYPKEHIVSIIPHYVDFDYFMRNYGEKFHIIDIRTDDIDRVLEEILKSQYIFSSSLHGLIIAHVYHIPALWIRYSDFGKGGDVCFKYHDYFSSVNIPFYNGFFDLDKLLENGKGIADFFEKNSEIAHIHCDLSLIQKELLRSFPFALKKKYQEWIDF